MCPMLPLASLSSPRPAPLLYAPAPPPQVSHLAGQTFTYMLSYSKAAHSGKLYFTLIVYQALCLELIVQC